MISFNTREFKIFSIMLFAWAIVQGLSTSLSIIISLVVMAFSAYMLISKKQMISWGRLPLLYWIFFAFTLSMFASLVWNWTDMIQPTRGLSKMRYLLVYILAIPWIINLELNDLIKKTVLKSILYLNLSYALASIIGMYAMFFCFQLNQLSSVCAARNPGMTGIMQFAFETPLVVCTGLIVLIFKRHLLSKNEIYILIIALALMTWGLLISNSRGGILGLFIVGFLAIVFSWKKISLKTIGILLSILIVIVAVTAIIRPDIILNSRFVQRQTSESTNVRMELNRMSLNAFKERPLFGWGLLHPKSKFIGHNDDDSFFTLQDTHNTFTQVLVDGGMIGFGLYFIFFITLFYRNWKSKFHEAKMMNVLWCAFLITSAVHSMLVTGTGTAVILLMLLVGNVVLLYNPSYCKN